MQTIFSVVDLQHPSPSQTPSHQKLAHSGPNDSSSDIPSTKYESSAVPIQNAYDPELFEDWFHHKALVDEKGIQPDETGFRIGVGKNQWIVMRDSSGEMCLESSTNRDFVTICEAISGDSTVLPPAVILSGVLHKWQWYTTTDIPDDTLIAVSKIGYSNDGLSLEWLTDFEWLKFTSRHETGAYRLESYSSHCTKQFIDYWDQYNIIPFCFPPHTTHLLQPLDVVFQPFKHYHAEAVEQATRSGCSDCNKVQF